MKKCQVCGVLLNVKNPKNYGKDPRHISRHHLFPKRFKKYFTESEICSIFQIESFSVIVEFCYECHEEVFHNIILNKEMIERLSGLFTGKSKKAKIKLLHQVLKEGIDAYTKKIKP